MIRSIRIGEHGGNRGKIWKEIGEKVEKRGKCGKGGRKKKGNKGKKWKVGRNGKNENKGVWSKKADARGVGGK